MKKVFIFTGTFFHWLWKLLTTLTTLVISLFLLAFLLVFFSLLFKPAVKVPDGAALIIAPAGDIVEESTAIDPLARIINGLVGLPLPEETLLQDILDAVNAAAGDDRISLLIFSLSRMGSSGLDQLEIIGQSIKAFQKTGKKVIAVDDLYNQGGYYLASHADEILLNPMGTVDLRGIGVYRIYMKELLDRLAVNLHVFKVGTFKSALEPFTRQDMSEEDKEANQLWLANLWSGFRHRIAVNRNLEPQFINDLIDNMPLYLQRAGGSSSRMILDAGLVDQLKTKPEINRYLTELVGEDKDNRTFKQIHFNDYLETIPRSYIDREINSNKIGILIARGNIIYGEDLPGQISSEKLSQLIRQATQDERVRAMVLRIDSGGGSALASELIRQELLLFQQTGKPLVVSMGSLAASGAYWISASADRILASPFTLTGSIGIFGIMPTFEDTLAKLGVNSDGIGTTRLASSYNLSLPMAPELEEIIQLNVEEGYSRFLKIVAQGRDLPMDKVRELAEGRVWDGESALELGLVDELGSLKDAIAAAAGLAGLQEYEPVYIREARGLLLLRMLGRKPTPLLDGKNTGNTPWWLRGLIGRTDYRFLFNDPQYSYAHALIFRPAF